MRRCRAPIFAGSPALLLRAARNQMADNGMTGLTVSAGKQYQLFALQN
jgi:hypothetical protein